MFAALDALGGWIAGLIRAWMSGCAQCNAAAPRARSLSTRGR